jgi:hypothetical protein
MIKKQDKQAQDVFVPFRADLPAGHSKFTVEIPTPFADRDFFFSYVALVPDFYAQQAMGFDLDVSDELNQLMLYEMYLSVNFKPDPKLYPSSFTIPTSVTTTAECATEINNFFQTNKPLGLLHLGTFLDWTDIRFNPDQHVTFENFIKLMAPAYYGETYNPAKHFNALPISARTVEGANNFLYPTILSLATIENLRFRLNIAPNTNFIMSTNGQFKSLGFSDEQIGKREGRGTGQYILKNRSKMSFETIEADDQPKVLLSKELPLTIKLSVYQPNFYSDTVTISLTKGESIKNVNYATAIKNGLKELAEKCNIEINFSYSESDKIFSFSFPLNLSMDDLTLTFPTELSERLGFGLINDISNNNKIGKKSDDTINVKDLANKARALVMDTSLVIISDDNTSANTTSGIYEKYMCALYPTGQGTMEIPQTEFCYDPATLTVPSIYLGSTATVPVTFRLSRYLDRSVLVNLIWKTGGYVFGVLRGTKK